MCDAPTALCDWRSWWVGWPRLSASEKRRRRRHGHSLFHVPTERVGDRCGVEMFSVGGPSRVHAIVQALIGLVAVGLISAPLVGKYETLKTSAVVPALGRSGVP